MATRPRRKCVGLRRRAQILLHDREPYRAARAVLFGDVAPRVLGIVTRVKRPEQLLGSADDLLETERTELSADDPEAIHGHSPGWVGCCYSAAAGSFAPSNCSFSVESVRAVVEAVPPETATLIRSKSPGRTSRWWRVAV